MPRFGKFELPQLQGRITEKVVLYFKVLKHPAAQADPVVICFACSYVCRPLFLMTSPRWIAAAVFTVMALYNIRQDFRHFRRSRMRGESRQLSDDEYDSLSVSSFGAHEQCGS